MALTVTYHNSLLRAMSSGVAPYFRTYLLSLRPVESTAVPTAAVDSSLRVYWNRAFFAGLDIDQGAFVVLHEMMHPFLQHASRAKRHGVTDFSIWNTACDCEINRTLSQMQGVKVPASVCLPAGFDLPPDGRAEEYYDTLRMKEAAKQEPEPESDEEEEEEPGDKGDTPDDGDDGDKPEPGDKGEPAPGKPGDKGEHGSGTGDVPGSYELPVDDDDTPGVSSVEQKMTREEAAKDIKEYAAKRQGHIPGSLVREAEAIMAPAKVPWQRVLRATINTGINTVSGYDEPTYRRVAAKSFSLGGSILLPTYESNTPMVSIVIDTSGSMSTKDLQTALRETQGVCKALDCPITVFTCDTEVSKGVAVTNVRDIKLHGGGGTDMSHAIGVVMVAKPRPNILVVLTDGYTDWPGINPNPRIKTIAIITEGGCPTTDGIPSWITAIKVK